MINLNEFLVKKHTKKEILTLPEIISRYKPEYIIICYYSEYNNADIDKAYIMCMGTEDECNEFAGVTHWKKDYIDGVSKEMDDKIKQIIYDKLSIDINLDESGWFIEYHKVNDTLELSNANEDIKFINLAV